MCIQRRKANDFGIDFQAKFINIPENYVISSDEHRIMQVLLNLQSNALKFTETGHVHILVSIENENDYNYLKIEVEDTGIGIKE